MLTMNHWFKKYGTIILLFILVAIRADAAEEVTSLVP